MYANLFKRQITFACVPVILGDISWPDIQNDVYQNCEKRTFRPNILYDKFSPVAIFFLPNVFVWNHCYYHINLFNFINVLNCMFSSPYTNINVDSRSYPAIQFNEQYIRICNWSLVYLWLMYIIPIAITCIYIYINVSTSFNNHKAFNPCSIHVNMYIHLYL